MAVIRPSDLPAAESVPSGATIPIDTGSAVEKATPAQIVDSATPLASQADAEAGTDNAKRVSPLRVAQAIEALGISAAALGSDTGSALVGVGANTTLQDVIAVNMARFGLREAASAANNLTAFEDAIGEYGGGSQPVKLIVPPGTYEMDLLGIETPNIWIDGQDSTFTEGGRITVSPDATGFRLLNARFYLDTASAIVTLNSSFGGWSNVTFEKFGAGDGYMAVTEGGASDNVFTDTRFIGGNGMFIEGERLLFNGVHGVGRTAGGDDFLVFKARNRRTGDIKIVGAYAENYSNGFAMGSEIGTLGAASASRAGRVENVSVDMLLKNCAYGGYIKPGAIDVADDPPGTAAAYDWRDGLVRGVSGRIRMADPSGTKMRRGLVISPARNALVEFVDIKLQGEGRFANSADTACWAHLFMPDSTVYAAPGSGGIARDIDIDVIGFDPYGGLNGGGASPGYPAMHGVFVEKQASGVGTVERVTITAKIDGTKGAGINVSAGLDNAVTVKEFRGRTLCNAPLSTQGGITTASIMRAPGRNVISMANTTYKPIVLTGSGDVIGRREMMGLTGAAGVTVSAFRLFDTGVWLRKASAVSQTGVGASGTDYISLELRALSGTRNDGTAVSGNAFGGFNTSATAITANVPFNLGAFDTSGSTYDDRFLSAGALLRAQKSGVGSGQAFQGTVFLDYVQIGEEG